MASLARDSMMGRKAACPPRTRGYSVPNVGSTVTGSREGSEARQRLGSMGTQGMGSSGEILPLYQLENLAKHRYAAQGTSMLEPLMQPFWKVVVEWLPLWIAPNTLTLIGLIVNAATTLILVLYCPTATEGAPSWAYYLCAAGLFIYQTLDAIDGKQARRTNSSSPLGELFDHGCDALSIVFVAVGTCIVVQLGTQPKLMFGECFATMLVYYSAHWQTYCSAVLQFGFIDVTEAQLAVIAVCIMTGLFGPDIWNLEVLSTGYPLKLLPAAASICGGLWSLKNNLLVIFFKGGIGKNGSTVAGTSVIAPALPISVLLAIGIWVAVNSPSQLFLKHPILLIITFGLTASKLSNKLVLAHMSRGEMTLMDSAFISPVLLVLNIYLSININEFYLLCFCFLYALVDLIVYSSQVCRIICNHLNIHCFHIDTPPADSQPITAQHHLIDRGGASCRQTSHNGSFHDKSKH